MFKVDGEGAGNGKRCVGIRMSANHRPIKSGATINTVCVWWVDRCCVYLLTHPSPRPIPPIF